MFLSFLSSLFLLVSGPAVAHDFHISRTKVEYVQPRQELQLTLHVFIDDLEEGLRRQGHDALHLGTEREAAEADRYIQAYVQQNLQLSLEGVRIQYQWLGKEVSEDLSAFYVYLLVEEVPTPHRLLVRNSLLMEIYDDQQNIVQLIGPDDQRGNFIFHRGYREDTAVFE
ncbi:MAG: hypothetical protein KDC54_25045 [Lewinella sp.]|nr:hypothetical protein [Lewinella sp.]